MFWRKNKTAETKPIEKKSSAANNRSSSYMKKNVEKNTTTSIKESVVNNQYTISYPSTNITYSVNGGLQRFWKIFESDKKDKQYDVYIYLLGKNFATKAEALKYFQTIIWFSYRKIPGMTKEINSDTSWGCLIRVGQMCMAAALKKFFTLEGKYKEDTINLNIVPAFLDYKETVSMYSLPKIVQTAHDKFGINFGQWFTVTQICSTLDMIHTKNPMRGTQNLKTIFFSSSQIFLEDVFALMDEQIYCKCAKRKVICAFCKPEHVQQRSRPIESFAINRGPNEQGFTKSFDKKFNSYYIPKSTQSKLKKPPKKHVLIFAACQLAMSGAKIPNTKFNQLKDLLSLSCSLGIVGGIPRKGLYFVGYDQKDSKLIYLDPHYVQQQVQRINLLEMMKTFFNHDIRKCCRDDLDPSMALVFYIDNLNSLNQLKQKIEDISNCYEDYIISVDWKNQFSNHNGKFEEEDLESQMDDRNNDLDNSFIID